LVSILIVQFFDFLFLNPISPLVSEAIEHDLFGNGCTMPHGFGQLPVELGSSAVGVSPTCTPAIDALGFNHVEVHTPITAFADVPSYAVNVDGVDVELLLGHRFPLLFARRRSCQVFVLAFAWSRPLGRLDATVARGRAISGLRFPVFLGFFATARISVSAVVVTSASMREMAVFIGFDLCFGHYWDTTAARH
jgi:hypothetical protein